MANYSIYAIPLYIFVAMVPHVYSVILLSQHKQRWNNVSPRSQAFSSKLQKSVPPTSLAKFERSRAAHNNMMENMAYFVGAVVVGNLARLDAGFLNTSMLLYFSTRTVYLVSYIQTEKMQLSHFRSIIYIAGLVVLTVIYVKAGGVVAREGY